MKTNNRKRSHLIHVPYARVVLLLCVLGAAGIGHPDSSDAAMVSGESRTYIQARETANDESIRPFFEYLDLVVEDVGTPEISLHFSGWLRQDLGEESFDGKHFNSDLHYAYLSYKRRESNMTVNIGRVLALEGPGFEQLDGIAARTDLGAGFGLSAFGGVPVETDFDERDSDILYGGRISHQLMNWYALGASYLKEENDGSDFREEFGVDVWFSPFRKAELLGRSNYNAETSGWMEHTYSLHLGPFAGIRVMPEGSWIRYEDYFTSVSSSAFSFQPGGTLDPREEVMAIGGRISYEITGDVILAADYRSFDYEIAGAASFYGGGLSFSPAGLFNAGISVHRMDGETDRLKYNEYRAYASKQYTRTDIALDLYDVAYDEEINGKKHAFALSIATGYVLSEQTRIALDLEYSSNPDFDEQLKGFIKLIIRFEGLPDAGKGVVES